MSEEDLTKLLVRVDIPDIKTQKCVVLSVKDTVWAAKQVVLDKLNQDLPYNLLNYGLYLLPSVPGKLGKYMDDGRSLGDYVLHGHVPRLEMRYKRRDYSVQVSLKGKDINKANTKANHRKFVEHVTQGSTKKIEKMLDSGVDPNFITDDGNTPLGIACGRNSNIQVIMPLLSNGAHIDFCGKDGLTPLHRAALGGNSAAIKILLSYGASPNYRDVKGLTPLYHTAIMGDDTACCESLLRYRAELGIKDHGGWTELHQATRYGHLNHADLLIKYGADLHAQNNAGNTPLHVSASHGQSQLAMLLLTRGTDKTRLNFSNQLPAQVAILCGHHMLSAEISSFQPHQVDSIKEQPEYHPGARQFDRNLFNMEQTRAEVCPAVPPPETLVDTLTQEWMDKDVDSGREELKGEGGKRRGSAGGLLWSKSVTGSSHSLPSDTVPQPHHSIEIADSESLSSYDRDSIHSTSTTGTPGPNTPQSFHRRQPTFATQRERLYHAGPGRYVALEDVEPQQSDDVPLRRGMEVEVVFIGKGGYWEGRTGGRLGWFPARAIQEVTDDNDSGVFSESGVRSAAPVPTLHMVSVPENQLLLPPPPPMQQESMMVRRDMETGVATRLTDSVDTYPGLGSNIEQLISVGDYNMREVVVKRGAKGYGFAMRGVKATKAMKFTPTPQVPALQYIGNVEIGGSADLAGLKTGDFLLEINNHNVTYSTHDDVVNIIRKADKSLHMKVITPLLDPTLRTSIQLQKQVEISNTSNTSIALDRGDDARKDTFPVKVEAPIKPPTPQSSHKAPQKETVIDDVPRQYLGNEGEESPGLDRINQSGWDSSQDEAVHTPGTPNHTQKFSYLQSSVSLPIAHPHSPQKSTTPTLSQASIVTPTFPSRGEVGHGVSKNAAVNKSAASLLPLPQKASLPLISSPDPSEENEEESEFTKALKKGKANLTNFPALRQRSSTMPSRPHKRVQRDRLPSQSNKADHSKSTVGDLKKAQPTENTPLFRQPLAQAIMRKIDSIQIPYENRFSDEEDEEETKSPPMSYSSAKEKSTPPAPKPKPQMQRANTVSPNTAASKDKRMPWSQNDEPSSQRGMQLSNSDASEKPAQSEKEENHDGESGVMNWKSVLRPVKRTESGRASTGPPDQSSSSSTSIHRTQSPQKVQPRPSELASGFSNGKNSRMQLGMVSEHLPPLLPVISNRLSAEFVNLPPPVDFMSLSGVEAGETSTDDIIPPPAHHSADSESSPSPPPPPPPDSSPPREPLDNSRLDGVRIPWKTCSSPLSQEDKAKVPSPIPSPLYPSSFEADVESEALLPPNEFVHCREEQTDVGFEIPTPPNHDTVKTNSKKDGNMQPDLDEAIRQLQQLSDDLSTTPSDNSNSISNEYQNSKQDLSPKRPEMLAPQRGGPQMISPVYTPPIRSRSSTSSSNVSSTKVVTENQTQMTREADVEMSSLEIPMMTSSYRVKGVLEWEVEEVCEWLEDIGLGEHCPQFQENEILGEHLLELTKEELAELGVKKIGHKKTFLTKVKELMPSS